jgi:hypothetical protein
MQRWETKRGAITSTIGETGSYNLTGHDAMLWIDRSIPDDPHLVFINSYEQSMSIIVDHCSEDGSNLINRMVFAQQVIALEAYLGDTLLKGVRDSKEAMMRLIAADKDLNAEKFTLANIAANADIVVEKVTAYLRSILYHNLPKVDFLYRAAFNVRVLGEKAEKDKLFKAINYRHDCIHRNGIDKEGKRLRVFTKAYVQEIAAVIRWLVDRIEREIHGEHTD